MYLLPDRARKHLPWALVTGLALRLVFVLRYPTTAGDTLIYQKLAYNWLDHGIYGLTINGQVVPADLRAPGYPAFLAIISLLFGRSHLAVMLAQSVLDLGTCVLVAMLAAALLPKESRARVPVCALWLAATCPFVANYCAVPLSEVLEAFLTTAAMLFLVTAAASAERNDSAAERPRRVWLGWLIAGLFAGLGTLVRPETPLLLVASGVVLLIRWRHRSDWPKFLRATVLLGVGLLAPLAPWAARNWITLHRVQFLSTRYAELQGEFVPRGFYKWTKTWLWRFRDVYAVFWKYDEETLPIEDVPAAAFDTPEEKARVEAVLDAYNEIESATPEFDRVFIELAAQRTARHPMRTYLEIPLQRAFTIWLTPRVELLPLSGHVSPIYKEWDEDRLDFCVTLAFGALGVMYMGLAAWGLISAVRFRGALSPGGILGLTLLVAYLLVRTAYLTQVETPEPRYVVVCFPIVLALAALSWLRPAEKHLSR